MRIRQSTPMQQMELLAPHERPAKAPSTRYQGSKLKLVDWIWECISDLDFSTVLDAFGGTAAVAYMLKARGKRVTYNDYLAFNHQIGTALIENSTHRLSGPETAKLMCRDPSRHYDDFIARTFPGIYFTDEENVWLDVVCQNISALRDKYQRAIAFFGLFQACISKRPYNLFHRKNLYMRTAAVTRRFGNKATWDKPFEEHFTVFVREANDAVFDAGVECSASCSDALNIPGAYDLVYIDTPYINSRGVGVDYLDFYHFLEGMTAYETWASRINSKKKHHPLVGSRSPWSDRKQCFGAFERLFERFRNSILVVSYRSDGIPTEKDIASMLRSVKSRVSCRRFDQYQYVLSSNQKSSELLFIAT